MEAGTGTREGSVRARLEATLMTAPMPTEVTMLARSRNSSELDTGNWYSQGLKVGLWKWLRMFSAV